MKNIVLDLLEKDINHSLRMDEQLEKRVFWWRRTNIISSSNEKILADVIVLIAK